MFNNEDDNDNDNEEYIHIDGDDLMKMFDALKKEMEEAPLPHSEEEYAYKTKFIADNPVASLDFTPLVQHLLLRPFRPYTGFHWGWRALDFFGIAVRDSIDVDDYADEVVMMLFAVGALVPVFSPENEAAVRKFVGHYDDHSTMPKFSNYRIYRFDPLCPTVKLIGLFREWRNNLPEDMKMRVTKCPHPTLLNRLIREHLRHSQ